MTKARLWLVTVLALVTACGDSETNTPEVDAGPVPDSAWETRASIGSGPVQETAVVVVDGRIYVIAGIHGDRGTIGDLISYDPPSDTWSTHESMPVALHHVNAAVVGGKIYVLGGLSGDFSPVGLSYVYDPEADTWTEIEPMPAGSERGSCAVGVIDDKIYLAGGITAVPRDLVSAYDPDSDQWTTDLAPLPTARHHGVGAAADGLLFVFAGRGEGIASVTDRVDAYDPQSDTWTRRAAIPTARGGIGGGVVGNEIVVVGGEGNEANRDGVFAESEAYDFAADTWRSLPPMRTPRHGMGAAGIAPYLYVPGGATVQGFGSTDTHEVLRVEPARP